MNNVDSAQVKNCGFVERRLPWLPCAKEAELVLIIATDMALVDLGEAAKKHNDAGLPDASLSIVARNIRRQLEVGPNLYYAPEPGHLKYSRRRKCP